MPPRGFSCWVWDRIGFERCSPRCSPCWPGEEMPSGSSLPPCICLRRLFLRSACPVSRCPLAFPSLGSYLYFSGNCAVSAGVLVRVSDETFSKYTTVANAFRGAHTHKPGEVGTHSLRWPKALRATRAPTIRILGIWRHTPSSSPFPAINLSGYLFYIMRSASIDICLYRCEFIIMY